MNRPRLAPAGALLLLTACGDPLVDPQTVIELRVLGAQLSSQEQPGLAVLNHGGTAELRWLVVAEQPRAFFARSVFCRATVGVSGRRCDEVLSDRAIDGTTSEPLVADLVADERLAPGDSWLAWLALCEDAAPNYSLSASRFSCAGGQAPVVAFYEAELDEPRNHNPDLSDDVLTLDGASWVADGAATCDEAPRVAPDQTVTIRFELNGDDREKLEPDAYATLPEEALTFVHVATVAGLDRAYSAIDPGSQQSAFEVEFRAPLGDEAPAPGTLAHFYLLVRDGRGGADWLERSFCIR